MTRMTRIMKSGQGHPEFQRGESSEEYLQRGGTPDKSREDNGEGGPFMAKGQKSMEPVDHPLSRSQQHPILKSKPHDGLY